MMLLREKLARYWQGNSFGKGLFWNCLLTPACKFYSLGASLHRKCYERGWWRARTLPCVVVSVGNLVVGGSGKTPLSAVVARLLHNQGRRVAVASRGYGRRGANSIQVVSDGQYIKGDVAQSGDEPWLLAGKLPGVPVLVGRDRATVGLRAITTFQTQILVLDDGFQHHRLARDLDLVTIDGVAGLGNHEVLPKGPLREPTSAFRQADGIVVVGGELSSRDAQVITEIAPGVVRFYARRKPIGLWPLAGGAIRSADSLNGREIGVLCGIARPDGFHSTLEGLGARIIARRHFADHHYYRSRDLAGAGKVAKLWVTTEKDAMKLIPNWVQDAEIWVLGIDLVFDKPDVFNRWLIERIETISGSKRIGYTGNAVHEP